MSVITPEEVRAIARLSRLALTDQEITQATRDLTDILNHFSAIGEINTTDVPPANDASGLSNISREDVAHPNQLCTADDLIARAPMSKQHYILVPGVFEEASAL